MKIRRHYVEATPEDPDAGWVYDDKAVRLAAVPLGFFGLNLAELDNWIEAGGADREHMLQWRARAIQAFQSGNADAMEAWALFLRSAMHMISVVDFMRPLAKARDVHVKQLAENSNKGKKARTIYSDEERARWRHMAYNDPELKRLREKSGAAACAKAIARREKLEAKAVQTIRKVI